MPIELPPELMLYVNLYLPFLVPGITLAIGLFYFLMPRTALSVSGITGTEKHPEGIGDGRSTFAGFAIALSLLAILFQPNFDQVLTLAWVIIAAGRLLQFLIDGGFRERVLLNLTKLIIAAAIAAWSYLQTGIPEVVMNAVTNFEFTMPVGLKQQIPAISAAITVLFGLIAFLMPSTALKIVRMKPKDGLSASAGEPRGLMAGMYLAVGGLALLTPDMTTFIAVNPGFVLGACWLITAFGRMIAILVDRCNNVFNWLSLLFEFALAALPLIVILDLVKF